MASSPQPANPVINDETIPTAFEGVEMAVLNFLDRQEETPERQRSLVPVKTSVNPIRKKKSLKIKMCSLQPDEWPVLPRRPNLSVASTGGAFVFVEMDHRRVAGSRSGASVVPKPDAEGRRMVRSMAMSHARAQRKCTSKEGTNFRL